MSGDNPSFNDSKNQFMTEQNLKPEQIGQFYHYMKMIITNPQLRQKMEQHIGQNSQSILNNQDQYNHNILSDSVLKTTRTQHSDHEPKNQRVNRKIQRKKGTDVLTQPNNSQKNKSQLQMLDSMVSECKPNQIKKSNPFDDQPLNSNYIKGLKEGNISDKFKASYPQNQNLQQTSIIQNNNKYIEAQERPICGLKKQFKDAVKEQFPLNNFEEDEYKQVPTKKLPNPQQFLRKKSREYLSSANAKKNDKNKIENIDDENKNNSKIKQRSTSQNRILDRRNNNKSVCKQPNQLKKNQMKPTHKLQKHLQSGKNSEKGTKNTLGLSQTQKNFSKIDKVSPKLPPKNDNSYITQKSRNVFADSSDEEDTFQKYKSSQDFKLQTSDIYEKNINHRQRRGEEQKQIEVIEGIYLTPSQLQKILKKHGSRKNSFQMPPLSLSQTKLKQLRAKYTDLCALLEQERHQLQEKMIKQREQFEYFKNNEMMKLKNQKRVMERQLKSTQVNSNNNKQREEVELIRRQMQKQRQDHKKKDKNNKIIIEKYKKEIQQLKQKLDRSQTENISNLHTQSVHNITQPVEKMNKKSQKTINQEYKQTISIKDNEEMDKQTSQTGRFRENIDKQSKKIQQLPSYKDIKNNNKPVYEFKEDKIKIKAMDRYLNNSSEDQIDQEYSGKLNTNNDFHELVQYNSSMKLGDLTKISFNIKMVTNQMINNLFRYTNNIEYRRYLQITRSPERKVVNSSRNNIDRKLTNVYADHSKEIIFDNGVRKQYFDNGYTIIFFRNGDIKQKLPDGTILYFFKQKQVDQITLTNGINIYRFSNDQVQLHYDEGKYIEIRHPDGTIKIIGAH